MTSIDRLKLLFRCQLFMAAISFIISCNNKIEKSEYKGRMQISRIDYDSEITKIINETDTFKFYKYSFFVKGFDNDSILKLKKYFENYHSKLDKNKTVKYFEIYDNVDFLNKDRYSKSPINNWPVLILEFDKDSIVGLK